MNRSSLTEALNLLGETLANERKHAVWLLVGGGSALLIQSLSDRQTRDVDVLALREFEGDIVNAYPLPQSLKEAVAQVATELRLPSNWINSAASLHGIDFNTVIPKFWQDLETREYGSHLKISFIGRYGLILLKICAALERNEQRDIDDLIQLQPRAVELRELWHWLLHSHYQSFPHPKLSEILSRIGHANLIP